MSECSAMRESMPLLLTESLDAVRREHAHQHIEQCPSCGEEWAACRETWTMLGDVPEVDVPARVKERFLERAGLLVASTERPNVIPFHRRIGVRWLAQAAAVAVIAGGGYFAGRGTTPEFRTLPEITTVRPVAGGVQPYSIAETRVLPAQALSPDIEGRPDITNVQFVDADTTDGEVGISFDVTSRWTVTGSPKDASLVRLLSYMVENNHSVAQRSNTMEWVRRTYSDPANATPEMAATLAKVLRNDEHEGVRIRAVETLTTLPAALSAQSAGALIDALKSDPNPAVRIKAVEALGNLLRGGASLDDDAVDTLRQKASQDDENLYVRVKAAEALSNVNPQF